MTSKDIITPFPLFLLRLNYNGVNLTTGVSIYNLVIYDKQFLNIVALLFVLYTKSVFYLYKTKNLILYD